ncbi:MAG: class I SAM-dependent methyltransferase [Sulfuricella sp.]|nr:class I SAM-dependent methyltransferase [Sulfuricella sp.]
MDQKHKGETSYNYKGIGIHAAQGLHEYAINVVLNCSPEGGRVLELGCGSGAFSKRLQDNGFITTSVDLSLDSFFLDSEKYEIDLNSNFAEKFPGKKFDAVVALEVIEHLENPLHFLRQLKQLADSKTVVVVSFPNIHLYSSVYSFYKDGTFGNWTPSLYWESGHQTIIPDWLFEEHLKKIGFVLKEKHFCALFDPHVNRIKRYLHKIFFNLVCFLSKGTPPSVRANQIVLFTIGLGTG